MDTPVDMLKCIFLILNGCSFISAGNDWPADRPSFVAYGPTGE